MAFLEQTATDLNDILTKANSFFGSNGWTVNKFDDDASKYSGDVFTGKRLHIQKDLTTPVGTVTVYANLRSANNQNVYEYQGTFPAHRLTGIACNTSRGYDGLEDWDYQTNSTSALTNLSVAGSAHLRKTATIKCHFYSAATIGAIVMEGIDQWFTVSFGANNLGVPFYACSGGLNMNLSDIEYARSRSFMSLYGYSSSSYSTYFSSALWKESLGKWTYAYPSSLNSTGLHATPYRFSYIDDLLDATPDNYTGNPILIPTDFFSTNTTGAPYIYMGHCPDIAMINMKFLNDEDEITVSSDTWKCYRINNSATYATDIGYALKK